MPFYDSDILGSALGAGKANGYAGSGQSVYSPGLNKFSSAYQDLASSNPYANVTYRKSWIQKVLESLGFRTNYDTYMESMNLQAKEYENALLQKQYNEQYDSPAAQAEREKAAGLNPDLAGNISSGSSSPMVDDGNPPVVPEADDFNLALNFAGSCIQGLQGAFAMAGQFMNLKGQSLDNRSKALSQISQEDNMMMDAMLNILPADSDEPLNYDQLYDSFRKTYGKRIKKRYFSDFVSRAFNFQNGLSFGEKKYSKANLRSNQRKEFYLTTSGKAYSEENEVMRTVSSALSDLATDLLTHRTSADIMKANNDLNYEQSVRPEEMANTLAYEKTINPSKLAQNEMALSDIDVSEKRLEKESMDYQKKLRSSYEKLLNKLDKMEAKGNWFAPYAKFFISAYLLGNIPTLSVSRSSKSGIGLNGTPYSQSSWSVR